MLNMLAIDPGAEGAFCVYNSDGGMLVQDLCFKKDKNWQDSKGLKVLKTYGDRPWFIERPIKKTGQSLGSGLRQWEIYGFLQGLALGVTKQASIDITVSEWTSWAKNEVRKATTLESYDIDKKKLSSVYIYCYMKGLEPLVYGPKGGLKDGRADAIAIANYILRKKIKK